MKNIKFRDFDLRKEELRHFDLDSYDKNEHDVYGNIMQFTGLTDKNGKDIYEGDILKNHGTDAVVKFERGMFCVTPYVSLYDFAGTEKEVIGNIHTTPKLLTQ